MKVFEVNTMERKTSFTREAVREAIRAIYAEQPSKLKRKKRGVKKEKSVLPTTK
jgi:hypothetical protein